MSQSPAKPQRGDVIFVYSGGKDGFVNVALQKWIFDKERDHGPWFSHVALALDDQIALETSTAPGKDDPETWSGSQLKGGVRVIAIPDLLFGSKYWRVLRSARAATLPKDAFLIPKPYISGLYGSKYSIKVFEDYAREVTPLVAAASDISGYSAGWTSDPTDVAHEIGEEFRKRVIEDFPDHTFIFRERTFYCSDLVRVILSVLELIPEQDPQDRVTPSAFFDQLKGSGWEDVTDRDYSNDAVQAMSVPLKATVKNHYDFVVGEAQYWSGSHGFDELWSVVEKKKDAIDKTLAGYIDQLNRLTEYRSLLVFPTRLKKEPTGFLWPRRRLKSARIRGAIVRPHQAASIVERTARAPRIVRLSRATVITRNAPSKNLKHSSGNNCGVCNGVRIVWQMLWLVRWPACGAIR